MESIISLALPIVLIIVVVVISLSCVRVIKQSKVGIIMRLGKFRKVADTGVHFLVPFIDQMSYVIDLRENVIDFPPQPVITKDNVTSMNMVQYLVLSLRNEGISMVCKTQHSL